ncbi:Spy/CpxP family protein refolding chaperone [Paraburkholderia kururiensis]|jgi:Spy/CpxP family protein refolding chaperone|uniref:Spy/CpxP family protein refolding chaperone n=2 Tax=Burkholderiaceae TaxID=119060 RepID=UPI002D7E78C4|nr:Spy/CpxP family protein refolding chaperone [Paraburkholderia kururiensis]
MGASPVFLNSVQMFSLPLQPTDQMEMAMSTASYPKRVALCLAGVVVAATLGASALAQSPSRQDGTPQTPCGRGGYGWGPGMMGGAGPGYGGGMMGYGAGRGMMRGYGYGMGPGMMMSDAWTGGLNLTDEQRGKIHQIQDETRKTHWALMGSMMDQQAKLRDLYDAPKRDAAAIDDAYKAIDGIRQKMIDSSADAHKRMQAVLTKAQLDKLRTFENQQEELGW